MSTDFISGLFSNAWSIVLIVLFFGGSIFVHELGHFLAARWRGVLVTRFSIGFGPKIFGWTGKDGVEYRLSWLPLGGYVALPQLADMRAIEGEAGAEVAKLPPISYASRMIVFAAGAAFNVLFAFLLATIIWIVGLPEANDLRTTQIGTISPTLELADFSKVPSPASEADLRVGDVIRAIDGRTVNDWSQIQEALIMGAGRDANGRRLTVFTIERGGQTIEKTVFPILAGSESVRRVGISPVEDYDLIVGKVPADSLGAKLGFQVGDHIVSVDGQPVRTVAAYQEYLLTNKLRTATAQVKRGEKVLEIAIPPRPEAVERAGLSLEFAASYHYVYPSPFVQLGEHVARTFRTLSSLLNTKSDIGLSKLSGPIGIVHMFYTAASAEIRFVIWFTILINISLAIFNLLPIPVLDGGHMLFATIGSLRGRPLPMNFIMATQSVFMMLLFTMILYVSFFDVRRWRNESQTNSQSTAAPAQPAAATSQGSQPNPAK